MDADTAARELYALRPGEFVAARDAKAVEARSVGERDVAAEIKAMRRPTVSAWVVNLFALERGERLEQLFSLGDALREAQASLSGETLRRLDDQRRQVIAALAGEAVALAAAHGQEVPAQVVADVEQTLYAALADADAATSVKAGRLTTGLSYTGFGDAGATARAPARGGRRTVTDVEQEPQPAPDDGDGGAARRHREQLRAALETAERALDTAAGASERAQRELGEARATHEQRAHAVSELEAQLADARLSLADSERDLDDASTTLQRARAALLDARAAEQQARTAASNG